jgi:nitroreductase
MRHLLPDPVPDPDVYRLLWAATRASSAHNTQPWHFLVLRDPQVRAGFGALIRAAAEAKDPLPPNPATHGDRIIDTGVRHLFASLGATPVIVLICGTNTYPQSAPSERFPWSAIDSAAQNLLVAARAIGLGAAYTMLHTLAEPEIRALLGVPEDIHLGVTIPVGYPARPFGKIVRKPLGQMVHADGW